MDFFTHIPSKDIRNHLRAINYKASTLQAVGLSAGMPYPERREALEYIIGNLPDCPLPGGDDEDEAQFPSVHAFAGEFLSIEARLLRLFLTDDEAASFCRCGSRVFHSVRTAMNYCKMLNQEKGTDPDNESALNIQLSREWFCTDAHTPGSEEKGIFVTFSPDMEIQSIDSTGILEKAEEDLFFRMRLLTPVLPTPFHQGDILLDRGREAMGPFVLDSLDAWKIGNSQNQAKDIVDLCYNGCFTTKDGMLKYSSLPGYLNLEFYRGRLEGKHEILRPISEALRSTDKSQLLRNFEQVLERFSSNRRKNGFYP